MAGFAWMHRVEEAFGRLAAAGHRRPARALLAAALLTAVGGAFAQRLSLNADLTALLPQSFASVQNAEKLKERFGGIGYVVVVGRNADPAALERFAADAAPLLEKVAGIRYVDYRRESAFFRERALYYLSLDDLREVERRLDDRLRWERRSRNPMFLKFDDEPPPSLDFSDLAARYSGGSSQRLAAVDSAFYVDPAERMVVVWAKPLGNSADLKFSKDLLVRVQQVLDTVDRRAYGPDFRIELTGTFQKKVDQQRQITADVASASTLALVLLLLYLLLHFRSVPAVVLSLTPVGAGLVWTYGLVGALYGQVNLLTGFLGAILGGLGIEHGIHLLGRWQTLRARGLGSEQATRDAFSHTGASAFVSALVAALTFASLALSEFRAFREFGVIAAMGMLVVVGAYVLVLPALLGLASRRSWSAPETAGGGTHSELARWIPRAHVPLASGIGVVFAGIVLLIPQVRFDYDFGALEDGNLPSFVLDRHVNRILGYSQTPAVVLAKDGATERAIVAELRRRRTESGARSTVDFVAALEDLVPADQAEKQQVLRSIDRLLASVSPERLPPEQRPWFGEARRAAAAAPFTRADLPESIVRQFAGTGGDESGFVLIFPGIRLSDGARVRDFAREVGALPLPDGTRVDAAGEAMILADIIELVTREAPFVLLAATLSVLLAMWLALGSLREALLCLTPTIVSLLALVGLMPLAGERFNYLNILVVPVLIGVTVDAGVHLVSRLREEAFAGVYVETGRAICGGLITSAVGFGALLLAEHPGLNSVGRLAILGFAVNLVTTLLGFPALFVLATKARPPAAEAVAVAEQDLDEEVETQAQGT